MKNFLVPTGEVLYLGTDTELANAIYGINGTMETDRNFRCYVYVPGRKRKRGVSYVIRRGDVSFLFRGSFAPAGEAYKVTYKVYPGSSALVFLLPAYALVRVLLEHPDALGSTLITFGILSAIVAGVFLFTRHLAIRQFVKIVEENEEDSEGIFD